MAILVGISSSSKPYEVVRTVGGVVSANKKLMMSRNPSMPSVLSSPTEMNVTGTPGERPTVY